MSNCLSAPAGRLQQRAVVHEGVGAAHFVIVEGSQCNGEVALGLVPGLEYLGGVAPVDDTGPGQVPDPQAAAWVVRRDHLLVQPVPPGAGPPAKEADRRVDRTARVRLRGGSQ